jgi:hypothetical protein
VRRSSLILAVRGSVSSYAVQAQTTRPIPPGVRRAEQAQAQNERDSPAPTPHRTIDLDKLKHDADELAALAQSVPPDVDKTTKGVLPKDLGAKLKRIEKLAKHLRNMLNP